MDQLDQLRLSGYSNVKEIRILKDRLKVFEGTNNAFAGTMAGFKATAGRFENMTPLNGGQGNATGFESDMKLVQVNSDQLKKLSSDPVAQFLETVNKLQFISGLPPSLKKDIRQI